MKTMTRAIAALALTATLGSLAACDAGPDSPLLARAAGYDLTVEEATELLASTPQLPADPQIVDALANLWVDYTLLAHAAAEDPSLRGVALEPLLERQFEQEMIFALRDSMVDADTTITADELRSVFRQEAPGVELRARHILLSVDQQATQAQRDSLRALAEELAQRAAAGADFAELARQYSDDPGSAQEGGDLGFFTRDQMVAPFAEAAFALEEGEVSDVVRTPFGFHVIKVEEKRVPEFDEVQDQFRAQVQQRRLAVAESIYVAGLEEEAGLEITDDAVELTRQMARDPGTRLSGRARERAVVEYEGGVLTLEEVRQFMLSQAPQVRNQIAQADAGIIEERILEALTQRELLVAEAREMGLDVPEQRRDSLMEVARESFVQASTDLGLGEIEPQPGEGQREAIQRVIQQMLQEILAGDREVIPLGPISVALRDDYRSEVFTSGVEEVVARVEQLRASGGAPAMPTGPGGGTGQGQGGTGQGGQGGGGNPGG